MRQHQSLDHLLDTQFDLSGHVVEYRRVDKGIEVDIDLYVGHGTGLRLWEGVLTLLSRKSTVQTSGVMRSVSRSKERQGKRNSIQRSQIGLPDVPGQP